MENQPKPNEVDVFRAVAFAAIDSIGFSLMFNPPSQSAGYIAVISENRAAYALYMNRTVIAGNMEGEQIESTLDDFVQKKATDPECLGIIPLTQPTLDALKTRGFKPVLRGAVASGTNYSPALYKL